MARHQHTRPDPRSAAAPHAARAGAVEPARRATVEPTAPRRARPDPRPIRLAFGLTGLATASALLSAFLTPFAGANAGSGTATTVTDPGTAAVDPGSVRHVTRYVQLAPGQTAPPKSTIRQAPVPTPRTVVVRTRQSGG